MFKKILGACAAVLVLAGSVGFEARGMLPSGEAPIEAKLKATLEGDFNGLSIEKIELYDGQGKKQTVIRKVQITQINSAAFRVTFTGSEGLTLENNALGGGKHWEMSSADGDKLPISIEMKPNGAADYIKITENSVNFEPAWTKGEWSLRFQSDGTDDTKATEYKGKIKVAIEAQ